MTTDIQQQLQIRLTVAMLFMSVVGSLGGWMLNTHAEGWLDLLTVQHIGGLFMQLSSVALAWFTKNPMNLRPYDPDKDGERRGVGGVGGGTILLLAGAGTLWYWY